MIGIVLVAHGNLASEFISVLTQITGPQTGIAAVGMGPNDNMEDRRNEILAKIREVDDGNGVIVMTDMFGGTPSNLAISLIDKQKIEVIAGFNLPMLIKLVAVRKSADMKKSVIETQQAGRRYIHVASEILGGES